MTKFSKFYITFGQKDARRKDGWVTINAPTWDDAQDLAMTLFDGHFSMCYAGEDFKPEYFPKGQIAEYSWLNSETYFQIEPITDVTAFVDGILGGRE
jgi:hypothetical protein